MEGVGEDLLAMLLDLGLKIQYVAVLCCLEKIRRSDMCGDFEV